MRPSLPSDVEVVAVEGETDHQHGDLVGTHASQRKRMCWGILGPAVCGAGLVALSRNRYYGPPFWQKVDRRAVACLSVTEKQVPRAQPLVGEGGHKVPRVHVVVVLHAD